VLVVFYALGAFLLTAGLMIALDVNDLATRMAHFDAEQAVRSTRPRKPITINSARAIGGVLIVLGAMNVLLATQV
jgi:hypothetical protein